MSLMFHQFLSYIIEIEPCILPEYFGNIKPLSCFIETLEYGNNTEHNKYFRRWEENAFGFPIFLYPRHQGFFNSWKSPWNINFIIRLTCFSSISSVKINIKYGSLRVLCLYYCRCLSFHLYLLDLNYFTCIRTLNFSAKL